MRALLTGATGLVGPEVLSRLLDRGDHVRVLALPDTVDGLPVHPRLDVVEGDLLDEYAVADAVEDVDVVYHLAARILGAPARDLIRVNVYGTETLLKACAAQGIARFVYASSVAVYAPAPQPHMWPLTEESPLQAHGGEQLRQYGQSKIEAERLVRRYRQDHGFESVIVRPPAVYGPDSPWVHDLLVTLMRARWQAYTPAARRFNMQWVHVSDLADGIVLTGTEDAAANQVFNLAGDEVFQQSDIVDLLPGRGRAAGEAGPWRRRGAAVTAVDSRVLKYDIGKARRLLGYRPRVRIRTGMGSIAAKLARELPPLRMAPVRGRVAAARGGRDVAAGPAPWRRW